MVIYAKEKVALHLKVGTIVYDDAVIGIKNCSQEWAAYLLGDLEHVVKSDGRGPHRIRSVLDHGLFKKV